LPDWGDFIEKEEKEIKAGMVKPFIVALLTAADIGFPVAGFGISLQSFP
jgi:hypothetical protein